MIFSVSQFFVIEDELRQDVTEHCRVRGWCSIEHSESASYFTYLEPIAEPDRRSKLMVHYPRTVGKVLEESTLGFASDSMNDVRIEQAIRFYRSLVRKCRKRLIDHVVAWSIQAPDEKSPCKLIRCSQGAIDFVANGGLLAQNAHLLIRFKPASLCEASEQQMLTMDIHSGTA